MGKSLSTQDNESHFPAGELDRLLAEGEADIAKGDLHDGDEVFRDLDELSAARRRGESA
jgi:hypothetical protein